MSQPRVLILRAPGVNCDAETAYAFELAGGACEKVHVNRLLENPRLVKDYQVLCLPGGFSYGDDLSAGRILGSQLKGHLAEALGEFHQADKLILGICNGFQILLRSGLLLPKSAGQAERATLAFNASGKFEDRWVRVAVTSSRSVFFAGIESMYLPVAHAEGRFVTNGAATMDELTRTGQVVLRYARSSPGPTAGPVPYPENPNEAEGDVAGLCDPTGRICGLMPHPERHIDPTQHPRWTREPSRTVGDGLAVFQNAVAYFR